MPKSDGKHDYDYCLPWYELEDRVDQNLLANGDPQHAWDAGAWRRCVLSVGFR